MGGYERATEMNTQRRMSAFLLAGLLAAPALAFEVKPGEWTQEISVNGKVMVQEKICLSPEQARKNFEVPALQVNQDSPKDCKNKVSQSKGVVSFEMKCPWEMKGTIRSVGANEIRIEMTATRTFHDGEPPATAVIKEVRKKISATEVVMISTTTEETALGPYQTTITTNLKYLGPTCAKDAKPLKE